MFDDTVESLQRIAPPNGEYITKLVLFLAHRDKGAYVIPSVLAFGPG